MFHLKFVSRFTTEEGSGGFLEHSLECSHYSIFKQTEDTFFVTIFEDATITKGVVWVVSATSTPEQNSFKECYITNNAGITVDTLRPKSEE